MFARLELTDEENDFYRVLLYRVTSSHEYGQPFLRRAFFRLIPVSVYGTGTMAVDKHFRVYIDFAEMMRKGVDFAAGILNHEIWHPLRTHSDRISALPSAPVGYDKGFLGNIAGDLEINDDISNLLPIVSVMPERSTFRNYKTGQTMEVYYAQLLKDLDRLEEIFPNIKLPDRPDINQQQKDSSDEGDSDSGQSSNQSDSSSSKEASDGNDSSDNDSDGRGSSSGQNSSGESGSNSGKDNQPGQNGSSSGGNSQPGQDGPAQSGNSQGTDADAGDAKDFWSNPVCGSAAGTPQDYELPEGSEADEMSDVERATLKEKIAQDIKQYAKEKGVGSGKSGMLSRISKWADDQLKTKYIPWNQEFRGHFMSSYNTQRGKAYYTFSRPARRQPIPKVLLPGMVSPRPTVGLAIDVSGSNLGNLKIILKEIVKIMKATGVKPTEVKAFAVDVEASDVKTVNNPMTLLDDLPVGGGTRMTPGYMKLAELAQDISLLITDGEVYDYPSSRPETKKHRKHTKFITCIVLDSRDKRSEELITRAKSEVGSWSKIIPIYVEEIQQ